MRGQKSDAKNKRAVRGCGSSAERESSAGCKSVGVRGEGCKIQGAE